MPKAEIITCNYKHNFLDKLFNNRPLQDHIQGRRHDLNLWSSEFKSLKSCIMYTVSFFVGNPKHTIHIHSSSFITSAFTCIVEFVYSYFVNYFYNLYLKISYTLIWQKHNQVIGISKWSLLEILFTTWLIGLRRGVFRGGELVK